MKAGLVLGKVALITGASRGIGASLAERYAELGMRLVLCSRSAPAMGEGENVIARSVDVRDEGSVEKLVADAEDRFGVIDLWVNNAGILEPMMPIRDVSVDAFREHIDINLVGAFIGTKAFIQHRRRARERAGAESLAEGVLINVSSGAAWSVYRGWGTYCAGKAALLRLTEVVAEEEAGSGIRFHSIAPGVVDTVMQAQIRAAHVEDFPDVGRFQEMKRDDAFNSGRFVADEFLAIAFDPARRIEEVDYRIEDEKK
jgi:NAD(P)-dependent dehydrogenase (short-subunit alcohol dehydrogenase family)